MGEFDSLIVLEGNWVRVCDDSERFFAHAQNLSMDSFPKVSLETYKFKFAENIAQKQALKGGGMQLGHFFFTHKPAPLLTMALNGGSKANQRIPVLVARDIHECREEQRRDICLRL